MCQFQTSFKQYRTVNRRVQFYSTASKQPLKVPGMLPGGYQGGEICEICEISEISEISDKSVINRQIYDVIEQSRVDGMRTRLTDLSQTVRSCGYTSSSTKDTSDAHIRTE
eukprot:757753-Prorocentrum_minimum.AAC.3